MPSPGELKNGGEASKVAVDFFQLVMAYVVAHGLVVPYGFCIL